MERLGYAGVVTFAHQLVIHYQVVIFRGLMQIPRALVAAGELGDGGKSDRVIILSCG